MSRAIGRLLGAAPIPRKGMDLLRIMLAERAATASNLGAIEERLAAEALRNSRKPSRIKYGTVYPGEVQASLYPAAMAAARERAARELGALQRKLQRQDEAIRALALKLRVNEELGI